MLINEITKISELEDVNLLDDLEFFMRNDPQFYRRIMHPLISQLKKLVKSGKAVKDTAFRKCVDHACDAYCKRFEIEGNPKSVFTDVDRDELARKIFAKEKASIENGDYDK